MLTLYVILRLYSEHYKKKKNADLSLANIADIIELQNEETTIRANPRTFGESINQPWEGI